MGSLRLPSLLYSAENNIDNIEILSYNDLNYYVYFVRDNTELMVF